MEISIIYNNSILLQFIGAIFSIILTVTVIYIKRENERNSRREYYETANQNTDILGDINIKIDEELPSESYIKLMTMWGLQPLLLLVLLSFIDNHNIYPKICWFFGLLIFTLLHEFLTALKFHPCISPKASSAFSVLTDESATFIEMVFPCIFLNNNCPFIKLPFALFPDTLSFPFAKKISVNGTEVRAAK